MNCKRLNGSSSIEEVFPFPNSIGHLRSFSQLTVYIVGPLPEFRTVIVYPTVSPGLPAIP